MEPTCKHCGKNYSKHENAKHKFERNLAPSRIGLGERGKR